MADLARQGSTFTQEVRLWETPQERESYQIQADLYAVFKATECLEKAFQGGELEQTQYAKHFDKLNKSFRSIKQSMQSQDADALNTFMETYEIARSMPRAKVRLIDEGRVEVDVERNEQGQVKAAVIGSATHHFISLTDQLQLDDETIAVDVVQPLISDLLTVLDKLPPGVFTGTPVVKKWNTKLLGMRAADELEADEKRQLQMEIDRAYNDFHTQLESL